MKAEKKKEYTSVKNPEGTDVYCPTDAASKPTADPVADTEECVEKDVVERYSGNIDIKHN